MQLILNYKCYLPNDLRKNEVCRKSNCTKCGWYKEEAARREAVLREKGYTLCDDGLKRLVE